MSSILRPVNGYDWKGFNVTYELNDRRRPQSGVARNLVRSFKYHLVKIFIFDRNGFSILNVLLYTEAPSTLQLHVWDPQITILAFVNSGHVSR